MSIDMNLVIFGGRLTDDPTSIGNSSGCRFDVASNRTYKKDDERHEDTTYMSITCWGKLAEIVMRNCRKGDPVLVEGRIEVRKFEDAEGSTKKYTNIIAKDVRFLSGRRNTDEDNKSDRLTGLPTDISKETGRILKKLLGGNK